MSLPITAVGPLNVLMKPIFTEFWPKAGAPASANIRPSPIDNPRIVVSLLWAFFSPAAGGGRNVPGWHGVGYNLFATRRSLRPGGRHAPPFVRVAVRARRPACPRG